MNLMWHICDVCFLVDGDETTKPCSYCSFCDAWLCERCRPDLRRRALAAAIAGRDAVMGGLIWPV